MGTSQTSKGPGSLVPMVPPWADQVADQSGTPAAVDAIEPQDQEVTVPIAPQGRFRDARRNLGAFVRTGSPNDLKRTFHFYVANGYGGSRTLSRRLSRTSATASRLDGILRFDSLREAAALQDAILSSSANANSIMDAIVEATQPADGTQDAECTRAAIRDALADLLDRFPEADLLSLSDIQREYVVERYVALDVYGRFCLDLRATVMAKASDAATGLSRLKQVRAFIHEHVSAAFKQLRDEGHTINSTGVASMAAQALRMTLIVFEDYS